MKLTTAATAAVLLAVGLSGCATVTRGTSTKFNVQTTPPGAGVKTSTGFTCSPTPCGIKMPRKDAFEVTVSKEGFIPVTQHVRSVVGGGGAAGMAGNVIAGGVIGMVVDGSDGAMNDLVPNPMVVNLVPLPPPPPVDQAPADPAPADPAVAAPAPATPAAVSSADAAAPKP